MTIANDIISSRMPDFEFYVREGESLDDIDEYGFTPLIESIITRQLPIAKALLTRSVQVNKPDVTGRTPLHWAVDNDDLEVVKLLLEHGAKPNLYTNAGMGVLVYPLLRGQDAVKQLLYQYGAKIDFALDFINAKLIGHRYELQGDVDIVNAEAEFIELDFEGFILEFIVSMINDSLRRFISSYSTRHLRKHFPYIKPVINAFELASKLLKLQYQIKPNQRLSHLEHFIKAPLLILPAASRGHAMCFVKYYQWWAKIDRGENSLKEGSINIYKINRPEVFDVTFLEKFLYKKQPRHYFHQTINQQLGLSHVAQIPISSQISGNCSWANVQAVVPVSYALQSLLPGGKVITIEAMRVYNDWVEWDKDRALDEAIKRFYQANRLRQASIASILGTVLFQACDYNNAHHLIRAEKILKILTLPEYYYILKSYLELYCIRRLTRRGNNLLKILDDCAVNPNIGVTPIATGLND